MTQENIAEALNLSRRTVARALSGDPKISKETKEAVLQYCESVGYKKNRIGSLLASPQRIVNAYLLISTNDKYLSGTMEGISEAKKLIGLDKVKFNIYSSDINDPDGQVKMLEQTLAKDRPDGVIIIPIDNKRIIKILDKYGCRNTVTIDKPLSQDITHVGSNYKKFGETAAQMMGIARRPHEKLLIINTDGDRISSDDYCAGFMSELKNSKAENYDTIFIEDVCMNMEEILKYKDLNKVEYIFAPRFLSKIIKYLDDKGYENIKYVACSMNEDLIEMIRSGKVISGININYHLHGYLAAKAVFNSINFDRKSIHYITSNQIIIKGSLDYLDDINMQEIKRLIMSYSV